MMKIGFLRIWIYFFVLLFLNHAVFAQKPVGIFENQLDIGAPGIPGLAEYDTNTDTYTVDANGATIGNQSLTDEFYYVYKSMSGSFAIETNPLPIDNVGRGGLMIRQSLDRSSIHISLLMTSKSASDGNADLGSVYPTFRTLPGGGSIRDGDPYDSPGGFSDMHTGPIRLERIGNSVHFYTRNTLGEWVWFQSESAAFAEDILAGLAATAENTNLIGFYEFTNVKIEQLPLNVMRDLPTETLIPGEKLTGITITAKARTPVANALIHEVLPFKAQFSNINSSAGTIQLNNDGTFEWQLGDFSGEAVLTYDALLGQSDSAAWQGTFTDGIHRESLIGGEILLPRNPQWASSQTPIAIDPLFPTLIEAERGTWIRAADDFALLYDSKSLGGISVVAMKSSPQAILAIPIHITKAGTYYVFGHVRSEDGNSDSFHFDIDEFPAGDGSSFWTLSSKKDFANEWVSSDSPYEDPRSFELSAGDHTLYLAGREDSASLDWLCVTGNRDLAIASFSEKTEYYIARSLSSTILESGKTYEVAINRPASSIYCPDMTVIDTPPKGWIVTNPNASGGTISFNENGQWVWSLIGVKGTQTFRYSITPPSGDVHGGLVEGVYLVENQEIPLPGDTLIMKPKVFSGVNVVNPVPVDLMNGEAVIEAEDAYMMKPTEESPDPFSILYHPDASQGYYVTSLRNAGLEITGEELDFVFETEEAGTYRVIIRSRTPSATDDSFFVGMDEDLQAVVTGYRFLGKIVNDAQGDRIYDDLFHVSWIVVDGDPQKSWYLLPGTHRFRIHIREDGTQVDWVMITNKLDRNPNDLETPSTSIRDFMLY